jgi:predicted TIM-barrel fold metal-dependent hydrolase
MDIVDTQVHLGPGHIDQTLAAMDALGIRAALLDEVWLSHALMPSYELEGGVRRAALPTAEIAALTHPDRFAYVARVGRRDPEMAALLRLLAGRSGMRGLRVAAGVTEGELAALAAGDYDPLFAAALDAGVRTVFVQISGNAPALAACLRGFPELRFVVDHTGMPATPAFRRSLLKIGITGIWPPMGDTSDDAGRSAELERILRLADAHPNLALKWAHAPAMFSARDGYPFLSLRPWLRRVLDAFGAERVMWGSDISANTTGETWAELLFWLVDNPDLSEAERRELLGGAARRWLDWPARPPAG